MYQELLDRLVEQEQPLDKSMFKPASEEELIGRRQHSIDKMWAEHYDLLKELPSEVAKFFDEINSKKSMIKIIVRKGQYKRNKFSKLGGKGENYLSFTFDAVLVPSSADEYADFSVYVPDEYGPSTYIHLSKKFLRDVEDAAIRIVGIDRREPVLWNNTGTTGTIYRYP